MRAVRAVSVKLWADDIRAAPVGWHWAKTVTEAVRILASLDVTDVSLDHDISHDIMMDSGRVVCRPFPCGETFEPVAWFIVFKNKPMRVNIHTANPAGAERLKGILEHFKPTVTLGVPCRRREGAGE